MPSDLDILMAHVTEINAKLATEVTDNDIRVLIAYHRHNRARRRDGYKPAKIDKPQVDILGMLNAKPKALPGLSAGTVRRLK